MPTGEPTLPNHPGNPVGGTALIKDARKSVNNKLRAIRSWLLEQLESIPTERVTVNASVYQYQISADRLAAIVDELRRRLADPEIARAIVNRVRSGYEQGTASTVVSLSAVAPEDYTRTLVAVLTSDRWQRRVALVGSRVFEQMQGFSGETATDLSRVLMTGVENGQNPREVAKVIRERFGVARSRAERIARTEITGALRRARWDEVEDARINLGVETRLMHLSALSPTTRASHAARHGNLYTVQEVREWYTIGGEAINCKCAQTPVAVDEKGNPVVTRVVDKVRAAKKRYQQAQD